MRFLALFLLMSFVGPLSVLRAENKGKVNADIRRKAKELKEIKAELDRKKEERKLLEKEAGELANRVKKGAVKIRDIERVLLDIRHKNAKAEQELAQNKIQMDRIENDMSVLKEDRLSNVKTYFVTSRILGSSSPLAIYSRTLIHSRSKGLSGLDQTRRDIDDRLGALINNQQTLRNIAIRQEAVLRKTRSSLDKQEVVLQKKKTRKQLVNAELKELETTAQELAGLIDILRSRALKEEEREKKSRLEKLASGHSPIPGHSLIWPVRGRIMEKFGRHKQPEFGTPYNSNGLLIHLKNPKNVQAVSGGKVLFAGNFMSYGPMVVVEHPGDWYTVYGRLSRWSVEKGQRVAVGDSVGYAGISEKGGGEVYFELRFYGKPTDPLPWLIE